MKDFSGLSEEFPINYLKSRKIINLKAQEFVEITEKELKLRNEYDEFISFILTSERVSANEILKKCEGASLKEIQKLMFCLEVSLKDGGSLNESDLRSLYQKKIVLLQSEAKEMGKNEREAKDYVQKIMTILQGFVTKNKNLYSYVADLRELAEFKLYCRYYCFLTNPINSNDCFNLFRSGESQCLLSLGEDSRKRMMMEFQEYLDGYSDDILSAIITRYLINSLFSKVTLVSNIEELINYAESSIKKFNQYGIRITDVDYVNYALGQCQEVILCRK